MGELVGRSYLELAVPDRHADAARGVAEAAGGATFIRAGAVIVKVSSARLAELLRAIEEWAGWKEYGWSQLDTRADNAVRLVVLALEAESDG